MKIVYYLIIAPKSWFETIFIHFYIKAREFRIDGFHQMYPGFTMKLGCILYTSASMGEK
jgi:hypothetical protein